MGELLRLLRRRDHLLNPTTVKTTVACPVLAQLLSAQLRWAKLLLTAALTGVCCSQGTVTEIASFPSGAGPSHHAVDLFGITVFTVYDDVWRTDGSASGTFQLAARSTVGLSSEVFVRMGDHVYFTNWTAAVGEELWRTDGTVAGTGMVRDYLPGAASTQPRQMTPIGRYLVFSGQTPPSGGIEVFVSDGSFSGTQLLRDILPGASGSSPSGFVSLGDRAVFTANDGVHGREFWITDGTPAGTSMVADLVPGSNGISAASLGVVGRRSLWMQGAYSNVELLTTDGTAAGTMSLHQWPVQLSSATPLTGFVEASGRSFFCVGIYHGGSATSFDLWSTDGTPAGTVGHGEIWPAAYRPGNPTPRLWALGAQLMYERETAAEGREPWIFDPATSQSALVADFAPGTASSKVNDVVFRNANQAIALVSLSGPQTAWTIDPSGVTPPVALRADVDSLIPVGERYVWFVGQDGVSGYEFWRTDGTATGTHRVGGEAVVGAQGIWVDDAVLSGGKLIVFGDRRVAYNSYAVGPVVWAVEPGGHTVPLGDVGAGGYGVTKLSSDDPVLGATMQLRLEELGPAPLFAITFDAYSNRATWLNSFWFYSDLTAPQVLGWNVTSNGAGDLSVALPATPSLAGTRLLMQGFGLGVSQWRASNGLLLVAGN